MFPITTCSLCFYVYTHTLPSLSLHLPQLYFVLPFLICLWDHLFNLILLFPPLNKTQFNDTFLCCCLHFLPGCTYNHQHAAADPAAPASAVPGAVDEAAATSLSFLLLLLGWSASSQWPRKINPGPLHRPTPGSRPRRHSAHQRAAVFAQHLQHLPSL